MKFKWFKNIQLFIFKKPFSFSVEELQEKLAQSAFQPCNDFDTSSQGWISPFNQEEQLVYSINHCLLIKLRYQEKILPASVIRDFVNEKVADIEAEEDRKVRSREKNEIKEQIIHQLLPRAFPRNNELLAYIDVAKGWFVVDTPNRKKAEDFASFLRYTLGTFPVVPPKFNQDVSVIMTSWLKEQTAPAYFELGEDCKLIASEGEAIICKQINLLSSEIQAHLKTGKIVQNVALTWQNRIAFVLNEDFTIKRLKFLDIVEEDNEIAQDEHDFSIMALELAQFMPKLFELFGDLKIEKAEH